jgi:hypothetical protein
MIKLGKNSLNFDFKKSQYLVTLSIIFIKLNSITLVKFHNHFDKEVPKEKL